MSAVEDDNGQTTGATRLALPATLKARFGPVEFLHGSAGRAAYRVTLPDGSPMLLKLLVDAETRVTTQRSRLRRELDKLLAIAHPCIASPQELGSDGSVLWLLRPWLEGVSAAESLRQHGAMSVADAAAVITQITDAFDLLHRAGLQQRDLRPGHVMLCPWPDGIARVRLLDTCLPVTEAKLSSGSEEMANAYRAPELESHRLENFRTDLFALGCVFYELLTGQRLFGERGAAGALERYSEVAFPHMPDALDPALCRLIQQLIAKDPAQRPLSARQVQRTVRAFLVPEVAQALITRTGLRGASSHPPSGSLAPSRPSKHTMLGMPSVNTATLTSQDRSLLEAQSRASTTPPHAVTADATPHAQAPSKAALASKTPGGKATLLMSAGLGAAAEAAATATTAAASAAPSTTETDATASAAEAGALAAAMAPASAAADADMEALSPYSTMQIDDLRKLEVLEERHVDTTTSRRAATSLPPPPPQQAALASGRPSVSPAAATASPALAATVDQRDPLAAQVLQASQRQPQLSERLFSRTALQDPSVRLMAAAAVLLFSVAGFCLLSALTAAVVRLLVTP